MDGWMDLFVFQIRTYFQKAVFVRMSSYGTSGNEFDVQMHTPHENIARANWTVNELSRDTASYVKGEF